MAIPRTTSKLKRKRREGGLRLDNSGLKEAILNQERSKPKQVTQVKQAPQKRAAAPLTLEQRVTAGEQKFGKTPDLRFNKRGRGLSVNGKQQQPEYSNDYKTFVDDKNKLFRQGEDAKRTTLMEGINQKISAGGTYDRVAGGGRMVIQQKTPGIR